MVFEGNSLGRAIGDGLFVVMWNYMGWDGLSTVMGEIDKPRRNFPKALAICIPMITLIYLLPTLVSVAVLGNTVTWEAGAYTTVAESVGGNWLGIMLTFTALVSAIGLFSAWLLSYSRIPFALADDGWLPPRLTRLHPRHGSPAACIIIASAICAVAAFGPFTALVAIDVTIYACALILQFVALIALRIKEPDAPRPFRVPLGWLGVGLITFFPFAITAAAVYFQVLDVGIVQGVFWALGAMATGPIMYVVLGASKRRRGIDRQVDLETGELIG
jgi:amino acid transporter